MAEQSARLIADDQHASGGDRDGPAHVIEANALRGPITRQIRLQALSIALQQHVEGWLAYGPAPSDAPADLVQATPFAHGSLTLTCSPGSLGNADCLGGIERAQNCRQMIRRPF